CKSVNGLPLQTSSQLIWLAMLADLLLSTTVNGDGRQGGRMPWPELSCAKLLCCHSWCYMATAGDFLPSNKVPS
ncbi:unnamed protein product, partial [Urochloa humidicola]